jgi:hypothetical protein
MSNQRKNPLYIGAIALVAVWFLAWGGFVLAKKSKLTAEQVTRFQQSLDWGKLSAADRAKALRELVDKLNAMSPEERIRWHLDNGWFRQLTDEEKSWFLEAFLPGEMKQALNVFERWPKERQQAEIDGALRDLRNNAGHSDPAAQIGPGGTNAAPFLSPELEQQVREIGLNTLYSKGSAQTRAQIAPLMIEIQHQIENGQLGPMNGF